jgi:hypothetical protein
VKQAAEETVNKCLSRANKILWKLKSNIDIPDVVLPAKMAEKYTNLNQEVRYTVINHVSLHEAARS